ncbi:MAG: arsenate reductase/protein-tyrosine-phosphatase family protein [Actinomycetota bacterium]
MQPREVIVVCYGNICRSPMGEFLLQRALDARLGEGTLLVTSAGIGADDGRPPSTGTIKAMAGRGIDVRFSRSTYLTAAHAARAWRIYCMEQYQVDRVRAVLDERPERVMLLDGEEVPDPIGSGQQIYEEVARQIERLLPAVVDDIAAAIEAEEATV